VRVHGCHNGPSDLETWAPLPEDMRKHSNATRDNIVEQTAKHRTAGLIQLDLCAQARREGGTVLNDRGVVLDRSLVPSRVTIQQIQDDSKRADRSKKVAKQRQTVPAWVQAENILLGEARDRQTCLRFRRNLLGAAPRSADSLWQAIMSTKQMLADAERLMTNGQVTDGKWRMLEENAGRIVANGTLVFQVYDITTHDNVEFEAGYRHREARWATLSMASGEPRHNALAVNSSIQNCMSCSDNVRYGGSCKCELKIVDFADRPESGEYEMRAVHTGNGTVNKWKCPAVIDKHDATRLALVSLGIPFSQCLFHFGKSHLEYWYEVCQIRSSKTLMHLKFGLAYVCRGYTGEYMTSASLSFDHRCYRSLSDEYWH
jgi:hypothetical protein